MPTDQSFDPDQPLVDQVSDAEDLKALREGFKQHKDDLAPDGQEETAKIGDVLPLTPKRDTAYIRPGDIEKAEWFADLWDEYGDDGTSVRSLHYRILHEDVERHDGGEYDNSTAAYDALKAGAKWAQALRFVDPTAVADEKNTKATVRAFASRDDPAPHRESPVATSDELRFRPSKGVCDPTLQTTLEPASPGFDGVDDLIDTHIDRIIHHAFGAARYDATARQEYYIEIWAEKSSVLPEDVAEEYDATTRPAGGGEPSLSMCQDAVRIAGERGQRLMVCMISDFDSKGRDMPASISRKLTIEAAMQGVDVDVTVEHAAVTKEQVIQHGIPGAPSKTPNGLEYGNPGAHGYETQKEMFREFAEQYPVEINAFQGKYPSAYRQAIEDAIRPYYDADLEDDLEATIQRAREDAREVLEHAFDLQRQEIEAAWSGLVDAIDAYQDEVEPAVATVRQQLEELENGEAALREDYRVPDRSKTLQSVVGAADWEEAIDYVHRELELPEAEVSDDEADPLLDTRRSILEQLERYRDYDFRTG